MGSNAPSDHSVAEYIQLERLNWGNLMLQPHASLRLVSSVRLAIIGVSVSPALLEALRVHCSTIDIVPLSTRMDDIILHNAAEVPISVAWVTQEDSRGLLSDCWHQPCCFRQIHGALVVQKQHADTNKYGEMVSVPIVLRRGTCRSETLSKEFLPDLRDSVKKLHSDVLKSLQLTAQSPGASLTRDLGEKGAKFNAEVKRAHARLCLGSPSRALQLCEKLFEFCQKDNLDTMWVAWALKVHAAAIKASAEAAEGETRGAGAGDSESPGLLSTFYHHRKQLSDDYISDQVMAKLNLARTAHGKSSEDKAITFTIETTLMIAREFVCLSRYLPAVTELTGVSNPDVVAVLNNQDSIALLCATGLLFQQMHMHRKAAFTFFRAALTSAERGSWSTGLQMVRRSLPWYSMGFLDAPSQGHPDNLVELLGIAKHAVLAMGNLLPEPWHEERLALAKDSNMMSAAMYRHLQSHGDKVRFMKPSAARPRHMWPRIQANVLELLRRCAEKCQDRARMALCSTTALSILSSVTTAEQQTAMISWVFNSVRENLHHEVATRPGLVIGGPSGPIGCVADSTLGYCLPCPVIADMRVEPSRALSSPVLAEKLGYHPGVTTHTRKTPKSPVRRLDSDVLMFNPFNRQMSMKATEEVLWVAGEPQTVILTLDYPLMEPATVDSVRCCVCGEGGKDAECHPVTTVLSSPRQVLSLTVLPKVPGEVVVYGVKMQVANVRGMQGYLPDSPELRSYLTDPSVGPPTDGAARARVLPPQPVLSIDVSRDPSDFNLPLDTTLWGPQQGTFYLWIANKSTQFIGWIDTSIRADGCTQELAAAQPPSSLSVGESSVVRFTVTARSDAVKCMIVVQWSVSNTSPIYREVKVPLNLTVRPGLIQRPGGLSLLPVHAFDVLSCTRHAVRQAPFSLQVMNTLEAVLMAHLPPINSDAPIVRILLDLGNDADVAFSLSLRREGIEISSFTLPAMAGCTRWVVPVARVKQNELLTDYWSRFRLHWSTQGVDRGTVDLEDLKQQAGVHLMEALLYESPFTFKITVTQGGSLRQWDGECIQLAVDEDITCEVEVTRNQAGEPMHVLALPLGLSWHCGTDAKNFWNLGSLEMSSKTKKAVVRVVVKGRLEGSGQLIFGVVTSGSLTWHRRRMAITTISSPVTPPRTV
ncbi:MAG: hypothetical protein KVP17_003273 [Porospora cf. gigantea B]|uniref:uncharacterized protein n=2 Tax=Porospora cf. gigantea B TaxID=2853592 RepID=UPI003571C980|nr:MAG: hypothetical protein KVP17_003273 [Porospora cf. gigantea B]